MGPAGPGLTRRVGFARLPPPGNQSGILHRSSNSSGAIYQSPSSRTHPHLPVVRARVVIHSFTQNQCHRQTAKSCNSPPKLRGGGDGRERTLHPCNSHRNGLALPLGNLENVRSWLAAHCSTTRGKRQTFYASFPHPLISFRYELFPPQTPVSSIERGVGRSLGSVRGVVDY